MNSHHGSSHLSDEHYLALLIGMFAFLLMYFAGNADAYITTGIGLAAAFIFIAVRHQAGRTGH